jgi:hypothetical protein
VERLAPINARGLRAWARWLACRSVRPGALVSVPDLKYRGCGWYLRAQAPNDSCQCDVCQAARAGRPAFIVAGSFLAAALLSDYAAAHPASEKQATG